MSDRPGEDAGALPVRLAEELTALRPVIAQSLQWMVDCQALIDGIQFDPTRRSVVAISLQHLCIEHHTGLHVLATEGVFGASATLGLLGAIEIAAGRGDDDLARALRAAHRSAFPLEHAAVAN